MSLVPHYNCTLFIAVYFLGPQDKWITSVRVQRCGQQVTLIAPEFISNTVDASPKAKAKNYLINQQVQVQSHSNELKDGNKFFFFWGQKKMAMVTSSVLRIWQLPVVLALSGNEISWCRVSFFLTTEATTFRNQKGLLIFVASTEFRSFHCMEMWQLARHG